MLQIYLHLIWLKLCVGMECSGGWVVAVHAKLQFTLFPGFSSLDTHLGFGSRSYCFPCILHLVRKIILCFIRLVFTYCLLHIDSYLLWIPTALQYVTLIWYAALIVTTLNTKGVFQSIRPPPQSSPANEDGASKIMLLRKSIDARHKKEKLIYSTFRE